MSHTFDELPGRFKVRDLSLAEAGRHQIRLAEHEMPGLMALRAEYATSRPASARDRSRTLKRPGSSSNVWDMIHLGCAGRTRRHGQVGDVVRAARTRCGGPVSY